MEPGAGLAATTVSPRSLLIGSGKMEEIAGAAITTKCSA
jgi:hypothetical protein